MIVIPVLNVVRMNGDSMSEIKQEVRTFVVNYKCDSCGNGYMKFTGGSLLSCPPQYPHRCTFCDAAKTFKTTYPKYVNEAI